MTQDRLISRIENRQVVFLSPTNRRTTILLILSFIFVYFGIQLVISILYTRELIRFPWMLMPFLIFIPFIYSLRHTSHSYIKGDILVVKRPFDQAHVTSLTSTGIIFYCNLKWITITKIRYHLDGRSHKTILINVSKTKKIQPKLILKTALEQKK